MAVATDITFSAARAADREAMLDRALTELRLSPLSDELHLFLDAAVLIAPDAFVQQRLKFGDHPSWARLSRFVPPKRAHRGFLLYGLPELGDVDDDRLRSFESPGVPYRQTAAWTDLMVPERLGESMPLHEPGKGDPYTWSEPDVQLEDGVLFLAQSSIYRSGRGDCGYEEVALRVYRVRGSLFHARYARWYWSR